MSKKPHGRDCEVCGEAGKVKVRIRFDRRQMVRWRLCSACAALKLAAAYAAGGNRR